MEIVILGVIISIIFLFFCLYKIGDNIQKNQQKKTKANPDLFKITQVKRQGIQLLESIDILQNTPNLDTLAGRMHFIDKMYDNFVLTSKSNRYLTDMQCSIDEYKTMYYDKVITDVQIALLTYPSKDNLKQFYSNCIVDCYNRYVKQQVVEMNNLKTNAAKERRRENIIKKGYEAKYMFKTYNLPDVGHLDDIEKVRKQFYNYKKIE